MTKHYAPVRRGYRAAPTLEWIQSNCATNDRGCWLWLGHKTGDGYARMWLGGRHEAVYVVTCELVGRPKPEGLVSDHLCRMPACCNPDHIEHVTSQENTRRGLLLKFVDGLCPKCGAAGQPLRAYPNALGCPPCDRERDRAYRRKPDYVAKAAARKRTANCATRFAYAIAGYIGRVPPRCRMRYEVRDEPSALPEAIDVEGE